MYYSLDLVWEATRYLAGAMVAGTSQWSDDGVVWEGDWHNACTRCEGSFFPEQKGKFGLEYPDFLFYNVCWVEILIISFPRAISMAAVLQSSDSTHPPVRLAQIFEVCSMYTCIW
jgi:hypothetical protein